MPNSSNSEDANDNQRAVVDEDNDENRPRIPSGNRSAPMPPPPLRTSRPSGSATVQDVPDRDAPVRADHDRDGRQARRSERTRKLIVTREPSGRSMQYPLAGNHSIAIKSLGAPNEQAQNTWSDHQEWESSDGVNDPQKGIPRRSRVRQPQPTHPGGREEDEPYIGRRYDDPAPVDRDASSRQLGEIARYYDYYNRDQNPFPGRDEYTKLPYVGGPPYYAPPMGPYPQQALAYTQPVGYAQPGSYQPSQYPFRFGYQSHQQFPPYNAPQVPPPWIPPDVRPMPPPLMQDTAQTGKDPMDPALRKILQELEDTKRRLKDEQERNQESMMHEKKKAKKTKERVQKKNESEWDAVAKKKVEIERQERENREYLEEAKEQIRNELREDERKRKEDEKKWEDIRADLRRSIQAEMDEKQEQKRRDAEKQLLLEREIRDKIIAETKELEDRTLKEELRKHDVKKQLEHELEMKQRIADELQQHKENIETRLRMEAATTRKSDLEKLALEMQRRQDQVIKDSMKPQPDEELQQYKNDIEARLRREAAEKREMEQEKLKLELRQEQAQVIKDTMKANLRPTSINVKKYLDPDQRTVVSDGLRQNSIHSQMGIRNVHDMNHHDAQSISNHKAPGQPSDMTMPQMTNRSSRPVSQHAVTASPVSVRRQHDNQSRNEFTTQRHGHVGSHQHLYQPVPLHHQNPVRNWQDMAVPIPSPSGLSSNINVPKPYTEPDHLSPELTESNLRLHLNTSFQARVENAAGADAEGGPSSFRQRAASRRDNIDRMPRENLSLSADAPLSSPDPEAVAVPDPPGSEGSSPARTTGFEESPLPKVTPSSPGSDRYRTSKAYTSPVVAKSEPIIPEVGSSREVALLEGSRPVSGASQSHHGRQLKRMKRFSR